MITAVSKGWLKTELQAFMTWAQRLKRVYGIDIEACLACGGRKAHCLHIRPSGDHADHSGSGAEQSFGNPLNLTSSHGCIHIKRVGHDLLYNLGAGDSGNRFVVHEYDETS